MTDHIPLFRVLAPNGVEVDATLLRDIVLSAQRKKEKWAERLVACDLASFLVDDMGGLYLMDECGNVTYVPTALFRVKWLKEV